MGLRLHSTALAASMDADPVASCRKTHPNAWLFDPGACQGASGEVVPLLEFGTAALPMDMQRTGGIRWFTLPVSHVFSAPLDQRRKAAGATSQCVLRRVAGYVGRLLDLWLRFSRDEQGEGAPAPAG